MSPVKVYHSAFQGKISRLLPEHGVVLPECAIQTKKGTKVADIAWCSEQRFKIIEREAECSIAPEICVEVVSLSNTNYEMEEKRQIYFSAGAIECWMCDADGNITFFSNDGELAQSELVPSFPNKIRVAS